ncbi:hypothetical protein NKH18_08505 [Streptomyces sp. M10(2022)]
MAGELAMQVIRGRYEDVNQGPDEYRSAALSCAAPPDHPTLHTATVCP